MILSGWFLAMSCLLFLVGILAFWHIKHHNIDPAEKRLGEYLPSVRYSVIYSFAFGLIFLFLAVTSRLMKL